VDRPIDQFAPAVRLTLSRLTRASDCAVKGCRNPMSRSLSSGQIHRSALVFGILCFVVCCLPCIAQRPPTYRWVQIPWLSTDAFGRGQNGPKDINNRGEVVGEALITEKGYGDYRHAFIYSNGAIRDLGDILTTPRRYKSSAWAVNDSGQVVGEVSGLSSGPFLSRAFLYTGGAMRDLGALGDPSENSFSAAYDVNNRGQVIGVSGVLNRGLHAFLYDSNSNRMTDIGHLHDDRLGWVCRALDINEAGDVLAYSDVVENGVFRGKCAFIYRDGVITRLPALSVRSDGFSETIPERISDLGQVTGTYTIYNGAVRTGTGRFLYDPARVPAMQVATWNIQSFNSRGWMAGVTIGFSGNHAAYDDGAFHDIGTDPDAEALFGGWINERGDFAGSIQRPRINGTFMGSYAFVYTGGKLVNIGAPFRKADGFTSANPVGINDDGVVLANCGYYPAGGQTAFLAIPDGPTNQGPPVTTAIPDVTPSANGFYNGPVQVTLKATDPDGPEDIEATYYRIDTGAFTPYTVPFTISTDGYHTVTFYSVDKAGNQEAEKWESIPIDTTPPLTTLHVNGTQGNGGWYTSLVKVGFIADDPDVPDNIAVTYYRLDNGGLQVYNGGLINVTGEGPHTISFFSMDKTGNVEAEKSESFKIDSKPPDAFGWKAGPENVDLHRNDPALLEVTVKGFASDYLPGSGLEPTGQYTIQDSYGRYQPTGSFQISPGDGSFKIQIPIDTTVDEMSPERNYRITILIRDKAGNEFMFPKPSEPDKGVRARIIRWHLNQPASNRSVAVGVRD
jgi:probable HAF family extracellular repeat protein